MAVGLLSEQVGMRNNAILICLLIYINYVTCIAENGG